MRGHAPSSPCEDDAPLAEIELWMAVLDRGIRDAILHRCPPQTTSRYGREWCEQAWHWIFSSRFATGSFLWCCAVCTIDPEAIRFRLNDLEPVARRAHDPNRRT